MEPPSKLLLMKLEGSDKYVLLSPTKRPKAGDPTVYTAVNLEQGNYFIKTDVPISTPNPNLEISDRTSTLTPSLKLVTNTYTSPPTTGIMQKPLTILTKNESKSSPCSEPTSSTSGHQGENTTSKESLISAVGYNGNTTCSAKSELIAANTNSNTCNSSKSGSKKTVGDSQKPKKYKKKDDSKNLNVKSTSKPKDTSNQKEPRKKKSEHPNAEAKKPRKTKVSGKHEGQSTKVKSVSNKEKSQGRPKKIRNPNKGENVTNSTSSSSVTKPKKVRQAKKSKSDTCVSSSKGFEVPERPREPLLPYQKYSQLVQVINRGNGQVKKSLNNVPIFFMCGSRPDLVTDSETDCPVILLTDKKKQVIYSVMVDKLQPGAYLVNFERRQQELDVLLNESSHTETDYTNAILTKAVLSPYYYSLTSPMKGQHMVLFNAFEDDPYGPEIFTDTTIDDIASTLESNVELSAEYRPCTHTLYDVLVTQMKEMDQQETKEAVSQGTKRPKFQLRVQLFDKRQLKRMRAKESNEEKESDEENNRAE